MNAFREIPRVRALSPSWFRALYERRARPVVLEGALASRPALKTWSFEHLAAAGDVTVTVRVSRPGRAQLFDGDPGAAFEYRRLPLSQALAGVSKPNGEVWYVQHVALETLPRLHGELGTLDYAPAAERDQAKLWICGAGTKNPLHWDTHHAALGQILGEKRFIVFSPDDSPKLAAFAARTVWRTSGLDLSAIDRTRFPHFDDATGWSCTVRPGDVLYVPYGWWHYMGCDAPSISVTWWWPPSRLGAIRDSLRDVLRDRVTPRLARRLGAIEF
ncbi:MAG TPA: cupin-like domain-containing protein [Polyangiaceae bacterium]|jgi:hypothetical protein|nr:cupin-like domain-containing protein [Polyangiaceae bacterium]